MRREQIEKIALAAHALLDAFEGVDSMSVGNEEGCRRTTVYAKTDEDVQAICGAFATAPRMFRHGVRWFLSARIEHPALGAININGPSHHSEEPAPLDDAKVDAAVAQADDATRGDS